MTAPATEEDVRAKVCEVVARVAAADTHTDVRIGPETSLVDDIGLDSLKFVDLAMALEDALSIPSFPMQDWVDSEMTAEPGERFTVRSLGEACLKTLAEQSV